MKVEHAERKALNRELNPERRMLQEENAQLLALLTAIYNDDANLLSEPHAAAIRERLNRMPAHAS